MKVIINGKEEELRENSTINDILAKLNLNSPMIVVEKNLEIISKDHYASCIVQENDKIEIVGFFGGG